MPIAPNQVYSNRDPSQIEKAFRRFVDSGPSVLAIRGDRPTSDVTRRKMAWRMPLPPSRPFIKSNCELPKVSFMATVVAPESFSIPAARKIVHDLFVRQSWIYWADMLLSTAVGYGFASLYMFAVPVSAWQLAWLAVASFALFRAGSFIHEIAHLRRGEMVAFQTVWNLTCGVPMLMPSFFYSNHVDHHNAHRYGTEQDGEYLPLGSDPLHHVLLFLAQPPLMPVTIFLRFLLSPLTFVHPHLRQWALEHASSFVINYRHRLVVPMNAPRRIWALLELACCLRCVLLLALLALRVRSWVWVLEMYVLAVCVLSLNYSRNMAAHHYRNTGREMSHAEQLADSVNLTGNRFGTELFFPLGLRYHALHHLFPTLPYHNLGKAHRRLMTQLPADSPYRGTVYPSYWSVVAELIGNARASMRPADCKPQPTASS